MTAIRPIENWRVRSVSSEKYPLNVKSSHPTSDEDATDPHHIFPRSAIGGSSWFVEITEDDGSTIVIPHVTGLSRSEHEAVELHHAWIRLEDGVFNWYDRQAPSDPQDELPPEWVEWRLVGPLNPQPGSVEGKPKRKKREKQPARKKAVFSVRVPRDELEDGYEVLSELIDAVREKFGPELGWTETAPPYFVIVAALAQALQ